MTPNRMSTSVAKRPAKISVSRKLQVRKSLVGRTDRISRAANRMDELDRKALVDFHPEAAQMGFDDVGLRVEMIVPDIFEKHRPGHDLSGVPHQIFEQAEFARLQGDRLAGALYDARQHIELEVTDLEAGLGGGAARPAAERRHAC